MLIDIKKKIINEKEVSFITIKNEVGFETCLVDYGAAIYYISYPDRKGDVGRVTTCPLDVQEFLESGAFYGKTVGRVAGRIADGKATINGKEYNFEVNEGKNTLHGGFSSWAFRFFNYEVKVSKTKVDIIFSLKSRDGEGGFPGNVDVKTIYTIYETKKEISIRFKAKPDQTTFINMTNHIYINLNGGAGPIYDQQLYLRSSKVASFDDGLIILDMIPTPSYLDYSTPTPLGKNIRHPILMNHRSGGMDHVFAFDGINKNLPSATLYDPYTKRKMSVYTNFPGIIIYCDNYPSRKLNLANVVDNENYGLTFETVIPNFNLDDITFSPDKPFDYFVKYKFN